MEGNKDLIPFEGKPIRKVWHNEEMYFSIVDVIEVLTDSKDPNQYWKKLKSRDPQIVTGVQIVPLSMGKRKMLCSNTEGILRIVMSVPSPKAEPLKLWLAEQGKRAIDEANDPELLTTRQVELYRAKGYPDEWIGKRLQTIKTRNELTDEWKKRGITEQKEYSILTAVIAQGTFGLKPSEHAKHKGLEKENLRDHMTTLELIFAALGEETTRIKTEQAAKDGFYENHEIAVESGRITGDALKGFEQRAGLKVVSTDNFLGLKGSDDTDALPPSNDKQK